MKSLLILTVLFIQSQTCYSQLWFRHYLSDDRIENWGFTLQSTPTGELVCLCRSWKGIITVASGNINVDLFSREGEPPKDNCITGKSKVTPLKLIDNRYIYSLPTRVLWVPFTAVNFGLNTLPFRVRKSVTVDETGAKIPAAGTTAFSLALNVGFTLGWSQVTTRSLNNYSFTFGAYCGPSTADIKKETVKYPSRLTTAYTAATMTYGLNIIFARNNLGLVFAYGWESVMGDSGKDWLYNKQPYFGFGVNTSFMK